MNLRAIKNNIPNFLTCLNLLCGCMSIAYTCREQMPLAAYLIGVAAIIDFLDGFVARALNAKSEIGKQLDSLADMVTFGVAPGIILYYLTLIGITQQVDGIFKGSFIIFDFKPQFLFIGFIGFLVPIFSAIRLAKFNLDDRQTDAFIGLPTPAASIVVASLPLIIQTENFMRGMIMNPLFIIALTLVISYLLVSNLRLFSLKFKSFAWAENQVRFSFLIMSVILFLLMNVIALPFIILLYIVLSLLEPKLNKKLGLI